MAALALACPASAADPSARSGTTTVHERLIYRDLDVSTRQGAHILVRRVEAAAQSLCAPSGPRLAAGPSAEERRCQDQAIGRAIAQLGSPTVRAEYAILTGRPSSLETSAVVATRP